MEFERRIPQQEAESGDWFHNALLDGNVAAGRHPQEISDEIMKSLRREYVNMLLQGFIVDGYKLTS